MPCHEVPPTVIGSYSQVYREATGAKALLIQYLNIEKKGFVL